MNIITLMTEEYWREIDLQATDGSPSRQKNKPNPQVVVKSIISFHADKLVSLDLSFAVLGAGADTLLIQEILINCVNLERLSIAGITQQPTPPNYDPR